LTKPCKDLLGRYGLKVATFVTVYSTFGFLRPQVVESLTPRLEALQKPFGKLGAFAG
jgi:hypothetical protein